jgi:hypothetical protein
MTTAREAFEAKKLAAKYGVVGKVAAHYRTAGYDVKVESTDPEADYHFTALKKGEKLAVKVVWKTGPVDPSVIDTLAAKAKKLDAKPILALYGAGPKTTGEFLEHAKSNNTSIRRFRG